ncbi:MAG: hypothetical protein PHD03_04865 [Bacilli bacterium]|nr:hypothetical protein [Bacilli bacterium]MDD4407015.1 hypothetical protein [Bacilli bacterium]
MLKKLKILLLIMSLTTCLGLMSSTYSRYVASAKSDINAQFSKWQILVDSIDITSNSQSSVNITPIIEENQFIASDTIAPSSKGYFDIIIDPTNVDVSFNYDIVLNVLNKNIPDLLISKYAILPNTYIEGDTLEFIPIVNNNIKNALLYNKNEPGYTFKPFTIRIYFEWFEGTNEVMNDEADTNIGTLAVNENTVLEMNANITFEQIIE